MLEEDGLACVSWHCLGLGRFLVLHTSLMQSLEGRSISGNFTGYGTHEFRILTTVQQALRVKWRVFGVLCVLTCIL